MPCLDQQGEMSYASSQIEYLNFQLKTINSCQKLHGPLTHETIVYGTFLYLSGVEYVDM